MWNMCYWTSSSAGWTADPLTYCLCRGFFDGRGKKLSNIPIKLTVHIFSAIFENITINHILLKATYFGLNFCCRQHGSKFNHCDVIGPKRSSDGENNEHYTIQGHSRSPISVSMESPYITCIV